MDLRTGCTIRRYRQIITYGREGLNLFAGYVLQLYNNGVFSCLRGTPYTCMRVLHWIDTHHYLLSTSDYFYYNTLVTSAENRKTPNITKLHFNLSQ